MSYVVESGASEHRRARRRRTAITMLIVLAMLFSAFWYAYSYFRSSTDPLPPTAATCTRTTPVKPGAKPLPVPADITVNVYNATSRNGLAAKTASELGKRGYKIATIANDPLNHVVKGVGEVRYGPAGQVASKVLGANVKGLNGVRDSRTDGSLDLVLGEAFKTLGPVPRSATAGPGC